MHLHENASWGYCLRINAISLNITIVRASERDKLLLSYHGWKLLAYMVVWMLNAEAQRDIWLLRDKSSKKYEERFKAQTLFCFKPRAVAYLSADTKSSVSGLFCFLSWLLYRHASFNSLICHTRVCRDFWILLLDTSRLSFNDILNSSDSLASPPSTCADQAAHEGHSCEVFCSAHSQLIFLRRLSRCLRPLFKHLLSRIRQCLS